MKPLTIGAVLLVALASGAVHGQARDPKALVGDRGCTVCHREGPQADAVPLAPSWREIAQRYRGKADAQKRLSRAVLNGANPKDRHWKSRQEFTQMGGNAPHVKPAEADAMVRWILSTP